MGDRRAAPFQRTTARQLSGPRRLAARGSRITVDLPAQQVIGPDGQIDAFEIDAFRKDCLLKGVDEISLTLGHEGEIAGFEARHRAVMDWL